MVTSTEVTAPAATPDGRFAVVECDGERLVVGIAVPAGRKAGGCRASARWRSGPSSGACPGPPPRRCRASPSTGKVRVRGAGLESVAVTVTDCPFLYGVRRDRERHRGDYLRLRLPRDGDRVVLRRPVFGRDPHREGVGADA